ncbi:Core-2/I-branching beta-1,6-N-acetylglucosaminyltransferase family protein [Striga asiatica]|uniref:Core-2/I-branching beta-1,6-N-acetylglucosaminyltransferase family protein n=1 Tax=Striga asiatica TaxID=4170 RepID=A0A5A7R3V5_STRAF|nr:Core-2/I-branching beta-1,6-N-acetylglucosaminyltransferase family protein [Striga asiatica]
MNAMLYTNGNNKNYTPYVGSEPVYPDHLPGQQHAIVARFASHNSQSYMFATEQLVQLRRAEVAEDRSLSPPAGSEVYARDRAAGDKYPYASRFQPPPAYARPKGPGPAQIGFQKEKSPTLVNYHYDPTPFYSENDDHDQDMYADTTCKGPIKPDCLYGKGKKADDDGEVYTNIRNRDRRPYNGPVKPDSLYGTVKKPDNAYTSIPNRDRTPYDEGPKRNYGYAPRGPKIPPQIKTMVGDSEFGNKEKPNKPQQGNNREVIDSSEARKRYGRPGGTHVEEKYGGTIDCREAARKYKGVFVTD